MSLQAPWYTQLVHSVVNLLKCIYRVNRFTSNCDHSFCHVKGRYRPMQAVVERPPTPVLRAERRLLERTHGEADAGLRGTTHPTCSTCSTCSTRSTHPACDVAASVERSARSVTVHVNAVVNASVPTVEVHRFYVTLGRMPAFTVRVILADDRREVVTKCAEADAK